MQIQPTKPGYKRVQSFFGKSEEIPENWELETIGKIVKKEKNSIKRGPWGSSLRKEFFVKNGFKVYEQQNAIYDDFQLGTYYINGKKFKELQDFEVRPGDLIVSCSGTIGKISMVPQHIERGIINQALLKISVNPEIIDNKLFWYIFQTESIQKLFSGLTHGSAMKNVVSLRQLKQILIKIPPLKEQQKISSILSNVDSLINQTQKTIEQTQRLKRGLMQTLLTKGIGHTKFIETNLAIGFFYKKQIPISWKIKKLKEISEVVRGGSPRPAGDSRFFGGPIPWITVGELTKDESMYLDSVEEGLTEEGKKHSRFLEKGLLVIANSGATLGVPKILNLSGCANDGVAVLLHLKEIIPEYLYFLIFSWIDLLRNVNQGMGQPNLNTGLIGNLKVPCPPLDEQYKIVSILLSADKEIKIQKQYQHRLETLKKGLMQKLLTGQIKVKI